MLYLSALGVLNTSFTSFKTAQYFRMLKMSKICTAGSNWFVVICNGTQFSLYGKSRGYFIEFTKYELEFEN